MGDGLLVVCRQTEFAKQLISIISSSVTGTHSIASSGAQARRMTSLTEFSAVLIAGRLQDETAENLSAGLADNGVKNIIIVVDRSKLADAHEILDGTGVTILSKPITREALTQAVKLIVKVGYGGGIFEKAKLLLVQQRNWTEPQAHRYIQKLSMDKRLPRDVTSQYVIRALEREKDARS